VGAGGREKLLGPYVVLSPSCIAFEFGFPVTRLSQAFRDRCTARIHILIGIYELG
jgi:hypothetical protein